MTGIMVSASTGAMNSLLGKLTTLMGEEFVKMKNLRKEVKYIRDELGSMKDALERLADVDEPDPQTKRWRNTLRELSYDIEDIIDDFIQNIGEKDKKSGFVRKTIRRLKTSRARHRIAGQIEEIKKLVHETSDRHRRYDLDKIVPQSSNVVTIDPRVKTLYEKAANLVGMEGPKNELADWLIDEEKQLKVVSVVGFGGLGKTTLANEVYQRLKGDFAYGAFVPVSQTPNIPNLLRSLLSQLGTQPPIDACDSHLIDKLRECLQTNRVPNWTRELYNLRELQLQLDELLDDGVGILAGLPSLINLHLHVRRSPKQKIIIDGRGAFPVLKHFEIGLSRASYLIFQSGAMPMVQRLHLLFNIDVQKQNGAGPAGIEHLAALEEVSASITVRFDVPFDVTESQNSCAESAFRSIVDRHPSNPRTAVYFLEFPCFMDD